MRTGTGIGTVGREGKRWSSKCCWVCSGDSFSRSYDYADLEFGLSAGICEAMEERRHYAFDRIFDCFAHAVFKPKRPHLAQYWIQMVCP